MSVEEELHEHAEHAKDPFDKRVAATMATIAAVLAIVSVLGHMSTTEELLRQQQASDQWAYYQAKSIRRYESEIARDVLAAAKSEKAATYEANIEKYKKDGEAIQEKATELEAESHVKGQQAERLHFGEVFIEISIVLASLAILSKRHEMWLASIVGSLIGVGLGLSTLMIK